MYQKIVDVPVQYSNGDIVNVACSLWHIQPRKENVQCTEQHYSCGEKVFHYVELPRREILKEGKNLGIDYNEYKKRFKNGFISRIDYTKCLKTQKVNGPERV